MFDRYGKHLNGTIIGPMLESDDIGLTCRVVGGEYLLFLCCREVN